MGCAADGGINWSPRGPDRNNQPPERSVSQPALLRCESTAAAFTLDELRQPMTGLHAAAAARGGAWREQWSHVSWSVPGSSGTSEGPWLSLWCIPSSDTQTGYEYKSACRFHPCLTESAPKELKMNCPFAHRVSRLVSLSQIPYLQFDSQQSCRNSNLIANVGIHPQPQHCCSADSRAAGKQHKTRALNRHSSRATTDAASDSWPAITEQLVAVSTLSFTVLLTPQVCQNFAKPREWCNSDLDQILLLCSSSKTTSTCGRATKQRLQRSPGW